MFNPNTLNPGLFTRQLFLSAVACLLLSGCASVLKAPGTTSSISSPKSTASTSAQTQAEDGLIAATRYWATKYEKNPSDAPTALNYTRNLRKLGSLQRATEVMTQAHKFHPNNPEIASELGRLLLVSGRTREAGALLTKAYRSGQRDWRTTSALGTFEATLGRYGQAQHFFQKALAMRPGQGSVINNLALAYVLDGKTAEAENLLQRSARFTNIQPIRQKLIANLNAQGKTAEAKRLAASVALQTTASIRTAQRAAQTTRRTPKIKPTLTKAAYKTPAITKNQNVAAHSTPADKPIVLKPRRLSGSGASSTQTTQSPTTTSSTKTVFRAPIN